MIGVIRKNSTQSPLERPLSIRSSVSSTPSEILTGPEAHAIFESLISLDDKNTNQVRSRKTFITLQNHFEKDTIYNQRLYDPIRIELFSEWETYRNSVFCFL